MNLRLRNSSHSPSNKLAQCQITSKRGRECNYGATDKLKCKHVPIDLVIVMDESSSIGADDYQDSRVGMVSFSDGGRVRFGLDQYKTNSDVTSAIRQSDYGRGLTNIAAGMHVATTEVFAKAKDRALRKVMLVITDGMDITDVGKEHALAEKAGIVTYVIGVGEETDYEELVKAAGDKKHVFTFANYQTLADEIDLVCSSFMLGE
ncbi:unnamed protein product [Anisakis simplex]|uniref:VWFA domain-containing protein n=1 Tax=Anisakis simplex TaxID=6269 RepID=A0A0M3KI08_ANISI|nr:unnamed protein product [Anisakis simplex]